MVTKQTGFIAAPLIAGRARDARDGLHGLEGRGRKQMYHDIAGSIGIAGFIIALFVYIDIRTIIKQLQKHSERMDELEARIAELEPDEPYYS